MKLKGWKDIPIGGVIEQAGNSDDYETGSWRTFRPVHDKEKCINCLRCWTLCPDSAILVADGKITGVNYKHCKGCGICARECPDKVQAYTMVQEGEEQ